MAANAGIFIAWDKVATGREKKALEVWTEALTYYDKAKANGEIEDYQVLGFQSSPLGILGGIAVVGAEDQLDRLVATAEYGRQIVRASLVVNQLTVSRYNTGDSVMENAASFFQEVNALLD